MVASAAESVHAVTERKGSESNFEIIDVVLVVVAVVPGINCASARGGF